MATMRLIYIEKVPPIRINVECDPANVEKVRDEIQRSAEKIAKSVLRDNEPARKTLEAVEGGRA